jgi:hypothetical protein
LQSRRLVRRSNDAPRWLAVSRNDARSPEEARARNAVRAALRRIFPDSPVLRCIVRGSRRGWVGYAIVLPEGKVTVAISPDLLRECGAPEHAGEFLREAGLVRAVHPCSSVLVLRHKRRAVWLTWVHRVFKGTKPAESGPSPVPVPQNVASP